MDDVGASSKQYEVRARTLPLPGRASGIGDLLFLKYIPPIRAWGPYRELSAAEWHGILELLSARSARLTVGVTAAWVTWSGDLVPFPERWPAQAEVIARGVRDGLLEVADHGLTHCVLDGYAFRPRLFSGNRRAHREFWDWIPEDLQRAHLERAQAILEGWLGTEVVTFVPPGNVFGEATLRAARAAGIRVISCATPPRTADGIAVVGNESVRAFHDRDLVLGGIGRLGAMVDEEHAAGRDLVFVRELRGS